MWPESFCQSVTQWLGEHWQPHNTADSGAAAMARRVAVSPDTMRQWLAGETVPGRKFHADLIAALGIDSNLLNYALARRKRAIKARAMCGLYNRVLAIVCDVTVATRIMDHYHGRAAQLRNWINWHEKHAKTDRIYFGAVGGAA